jgi:hypothetical protein
MDNWSQSYERAVIIYNATSSLVRFEDKFFFYFEKLFSLLQFWPYIVVNPEVVGLAPELPSRTKIWSFMYLMLNLLVSSLRDHYLSNISTCFYEGTEYFWTIN